MKNLYLKGSDDSIEVLLALVEKMPSVEVIPEEELADFNVLGDEDEQFAHALRVLINEGVIKHSYDYAWIMQSAREELVYGLHGFSSPQSFLDYLSDLGFPEATSRSTVSAALNKFAGSFPNWEFIDTKDPGEILRRKNVVKRFCSAFVKAKSKS